MSSEPRFSSQVPAIKEKSEYDHSQVQQNASGFIQEPITKQSEASDQFEANMESTLRYDHVQAQQQTAWLGQLSRPKSQRKVNISHFAIGQKQR